MKKLALGILIGVVVLTLSGVATAGIMIPASEKVKEKAEIAIEQSPAISGDWALTPPGLEKIEFIHWKKDFAKPETAAAKIPTCYKFLTPTKIKWTVLPVNYEINPVNSKQALDESFVCSAVATSGETWDGATNKNLFTDYATCPINYTATYGVQNYKNAIAFGNYPTNGVIAVTTIWYNPTTKAIVEFDVMFDTDWTWGDATNPGTPSVMDLQNIATHELGHGVGLADIYQTTCSEVTMYGYSEYGEVKKRNLAGPDITGLQTLYGQ